MSPPSRLKNNITSLRIFAEYIRASFTVGEGRGEERGVRKYNIITNEKNKKK